MVKAKALFLFFTISLCISSKKVIVRNIINSFYFNYMKFSNLSNRNTISGTKNKHDSYQILHCLLYVCALTGAPMFSITSSAQFLQPVE